MKLRKFLIGVLGLCLFAGAANGIASGKPAKANATIDYSGWTLSAVVTNTCSLDDAQGGLFYYTIADSKGTNPFYANGGATGTYLNDHQDDVTGDGKSFTDYFYIGNRSFRSIITDNGTGVTSYAHATQFPLSLGGVYSPVAIVMAGDHADVMIDGNYIHDAYKSAHALTIGFKAGCPFITSDGTAYTLAEDISAVIPSTPNEPEHFAPYSSSSDLHVLDVSLKTTDRNEPTFLISLSASLDEYRNLFILDHKLALTAFLTINDESIQEINKRVDDSSYSYVEHELAGGTDPSGIYNRPIRLFVNNDANCISVSVHPTLFASLFVEGQHYSFGIREGFIYKSNDTMYTVTKSTKCLYNFSNTAYTDRYFYPIKPLQFLRGAFNDNQIEMSALASDLVRDADPNYFNFVLSSNVALTGVTTFDCNDGNDSVGYNLDVRRGILINGTSLESINASTDVTDYDFSTCFPQNAAATYQVPVLVIVDGTSVRLQIHAKYALANLNAGSKITINAGTRFYGAGRVNDQQCSCDAVYTVKETLVITLNKSASQVFNLYALQEALPNVIPNVQLAYSYTKTSDDVASDFRLMIGLSETFVNLVNAVSGATYGVKVQCLSNTEEYDFVLDATSHYDEENDIYYVVVDLGDLFLNPASVSYTWNITPFIVVDSTSSYGNARTLSIYEMLTYYSETLGYTQVDDVIEIFDSMSN